MEKTPMTDNEMDKILKAARRPELPKGFAERLQAKLEAERPSNVIAFPMRKPPEQQSRRIWLSAIPLAASLAVGLYLGAMGSLPASFDPALVSDASDQNFGSGFEDTEAFVNGDLS
jgi:hypothetical protein